jgi:hypothetical protein
VQLVRHRGPHVDHDAVDVVLLLRAERRALHQALGRVLGADALRRGASREAAGRGQGARIGV